MSQLPFRGAPPLGLTTKKNNLSKYPMAGPSKEDSERAHRSGQFDMSANEGPSDSDSSTEKKPQEERRRTASCLVVVEGPKCRTHKALKQRPNQEGQGEGKSKVSRANSGERAGAVYLDSVERLAQGNPARLRPLPARAPSTTEPPQGGF